MIPRMTMVGTAEAEAEEIEERVSVMRSDRIEDMLIELIWGVV